MLSQGQWADTLLNAERVHMARLGVWALLGILTGSALIVLLRLRRTSSPLLFHFALTQVAFGGLNAIHAIWGRSTLDLRDLAGAVRLERIAWFNAGVDVGIILLGATLVVIGWGPVRRLALVGAGLGIVLHGAGRLLLDTGLAALVVR